MTEKPGRSCDIFCRVVDNYGDIGVCWRLARQLVTEHGCRPRLWVDQLDSLARLCPDIDPTLACQEAGGVEIHRWDQPFPEGAAAELVIEAFGCGLPQPYLAAMVARVEAGTPPCWINLEYLSAEDWVASHHRLPSPHPRLPLTKHFFIPGFTPNSGGLLREAGLLQRRHDWRVNWAELGLPAPEPDEVSVSLFCYDNPALPEALQTWSVSGQRIRCLLAPGPAQAQAAAWLGLSTFEPGGTQRRGQLSLCALPFYEQEAYDHLLWSCDLNFVRGEDSFVRAQWAARPLLWQAYPQQDKVHLAKLAAFLDRYCAALPPAAAMSYREFAGMWNGDRVGGRAIAASWQAMLAHRPALDLHARHWAEQLGAGEDLTTRLVKFVEALV